MGSKQKKNRIFNLINRVIQQLSMQVNSKLNTFAIKQYRGCSTGQKLSQSTNGKDHYFR